MKMTKHQTILSWNQWMHGSSKMYIFPSLARYHFMFKIIQLEPLDRSYVYPFLAITQGTVVYFFLSVSYIKQSLYPCEINLYLFET